MQFLTSRAGSAGGPKPGRAGFYLELGRPGQSEQSVPRDFLSDTLAYVVDPEHSHDGLVVNLAAHGTLNVARLLNVVAGD